MAKELRAELLIFPAVMHDPDLQGRVVERFCMIRSYDLEDVQILPGFIESMIVEMYFCGDECFVLVSA